MGRKAQEEIGGRRVHSKPMRFPAPTVFKAVPARLSGSSSRIWRRVGGFEPQAGVARSNRFRGGAGTPVWFAPFLIS